MALLTEEGPQNVNSSSPKVHFSRPLPPEQADADDQGVGRFHVLERGQPLLFKLRSLDARSWAGFFGHYPDLPISLA